MADRALACKLRVIASRTGDDERQVVKEAWAAVASALKPGGSAHAHRAMLVRVAEAAVAAGQHSVAGAALAEFLRRPEGGADKYRARAWLVEATLIARSGSQQSGSAALARTAEAVACCLRGLALGESLATTTVGGTASEAAGAGNPLVYNASVVHWRVVRPYLRPGTRKLAVPSLRRMMDALTATRDPNLPWRLAHAVALAACLVEVCDWDGAAAVTAAGLDLLPAMTPDQTAVSGGMKEQLQRLAAHAKAFADGGVAIGSPVVLVPPAASAPALAAGGKGGGGSKSAGASAAASAAATSAAPPSPAEIISRTWAVLQPLLSVTSAGLGITTPYVVSVASRSTPSSSSAADAASEPPAAGAVTAAGGATPGAPPTAAGDAITPLPAVTSSPAVARTKELKALALSTPPALPSGYVPSSTLEARLVELVEALHPPTAALYAHRRGELSAGSLNFVLPLTLQPATAALTATTSGGVAAGVPPAAAPAPPNTPGSAGTPSHAAKPTGASPRPTTGGSHSSGSGSGGGGATGADAATSNVAVAAATPASSASAPSTTSTPTFLGDTHADLLAWVAQAAVQNGLTHLAYLILHTLKGRKTAAADVVILTDVVMAQLLVAALTAEDARLEVGVYERAPPEVVDTLTLLASAASGGGGGGSAPVGMRRMSMAMGLQASLVPQRSTAGDVLMLPSALSFAATDLPALTPAQVARVAQARRMDAVKLLKTAAGTAVQTKQWHLVEFICTLGWNLSLPLLAASDVLPFQVAGHHSGTASGGSGRHRAPVQTGNMALQGALDAFAAALHDAGSTNVTLLSVSAHAGMGSERLRVS